MDEACTETPTVNSLLLAERVYRDGETNQWIIAGVFDRLAVQKLPFTPHRIDVFFQITNVIRHADLHLRVEHAETGDVVTEFGGPLRTPSPLNVVSHKVEFRGLTFLREGKYWVQLLSREELLTQAPLYIMVEKEPHHERNADEADE